jgi:hypothetical protein
MSELAVTRVVNATILLELVGATVITDPLLRVPLVHAVRRTLGLAVTELPKLA